MSAIEKISIGSPTTATPWVFVHGWGMSPDIWQSLLDNLPFAADIYLIDLEQLAAEVDLDQPPLVVIDALLDKAVAQIQQPAIWLGWSLGGQIALRMAQRSAEQVVALMMVASNPLFTATDAHAGMAQEQFDQFLAGMQHQPEKTLSRFLATQTQGASDARVLLKQLRLLNKPCDPLRAEQLVKLLMLLQADLREAATALKQPFWSVLGAHDLFVPLALQQEPCLAQAHNVIMEHSSHLPFITEQAVFTELMMQLQQTVESNA